MLPSRRRLSAVVLLAVALGAGCLVVDGDSATAATGTDGRVELMTCDGASVTAVEVDVNSGRVVDEHRFPLHGGFVEFEGTSADVHTAGSYDCFTDTLVPPQGRRWMFDRDFTRAAATTVIGFDQVQYVITVDTDGTPEQYAELTNDTTGWANPPLFDADGDVEFRVDVPFGIAGGEYTDGAVEIRSAAPLGGTARTVERAPRVGPDRVTPYFLDRDGRARVRLPDPENLDDVVPGSPSVDGWTAPGGAWTASWSGSQDAATLSVTDAAGRISGYSPVDCLPTAWLDDHRLLCTGSVLSDAATGVSVLELTSGDAGPEVTTRPLREASGIAGAGDDHAGEHLFDAVGSPDSRAVAVLGGTPDRPVLHVLDSRTGSELRTVDLAPGRWRGLGWADR